MVPDPHDDSGQLPPHNHAAEQATLGACLLNPDVIPTVRDILSDDDWYDPRHHTLWRAITTLHAVGTTPDPITVAAHLAPHDLQRIGAPYLHDLITAVPVVANAGHYARQVRDAAILRHIAVTNTRIGQAIAHGDPGRAAETLTRVRDELDVAAAITEHGLQAGSSVLAPLTVTDLLDTPAGDDQWLLEPIWPGDAYGVIAAEDKAGKSWAVIDMAVSVVTGGSWMGMYPVRSPGGVLLFAGEGGRRNLARRLRAVAEYHKAPDPRDLDLTTVLRVPHLTDPQHLTDVTRWLDRHPARLVILDPLYLAARGAKGSDLYAMGEHLEGIQHVCQQAGAALVIVTHFNKTGAEKNGKNRITGVGPGAWGRVLATAAVESKHYTDGRSVVTLSWDFVGGEIPDTEINTRRIVWSDDPGSLTAPLHYHVEEVPDDEMKVATGVGPANARVLAVLRNAERPLTVREIGNRLAEDGHPLKHRTIQKALSELPEVESTQIDGRGTQEFWLRGRF